MYGSGSAYYGSGSSGYGLRSGGSYLSSSYSSPSSSTSATSYLSPYGSGSLGTSHIGMGGASMSASASATMQSGSNSGLRRTPSYRRTVGSSSNRYISGGTSDTPSSHSTAHSAAVPGSSTSSYAQYLPVNNSVSSNISGGGNLSTSNSSATTSSKYLTPQLNRRVSNSIESNSPNNYSISSYTNSDKQPSVSSSRYISYYTSPVNNSISNSSDLTPRRTGNYYSKWDNPSRGSTGSSNSSDYVGSSSHYRLASNYDNNVSTGHQPSPSSQKFSSPNSPSYSTNSARSISRESSLSTPVKEDKIDSSQSSKTKSEIQSTAPTTSVQIPSSLHCSNSSPTVSSTTTTCSVESSSDYKALYYEQQTQNRLLEKELADCERTQDESSSSSTTAFANKSLKQRRLERKINELLQVEEDLAKELIIKDQLSKSNSQLEEKVNHLTTTK